MAESYRGLTIRIGGDTTKLTKALHAANQAISGTQSELRKLATAMRLDPTSLNTAKLQMGAMAEQAANTATKMATLRQAIVEVGKQPIKLADGSETTVEKLVEGTRQIQMNAASAREAFTLANSSLRTQYETLNKISELYGSQKTFSVAYDNTDLDSLNDEIKLLKANLEELRSIEGDEGLKKLGIKETSADLDELIASIVRLKKESVQYGTELKNANKGAAFKDLNAEAARTEATITSFVNKLSEANKGIAMREAMEGIKSSLTTVNGLMDSAKKRISAIDAALKLDPKNPQLIADRMRAVADGSAAAKLKVESLKKVIDTLEAKGIKDSEKSMQELTSDAVKTEEAFKNAQKTLSTWEGILSNIKKRIDEANVELAKDPQKTIDMGNGTKRALSEIRDEYKQVLPMMEAEVQQFSATVDDASRRQQEAWGRVDLRNAKEQMHQAGVEAENFGKKIEKVDSAAFMQAVNMIAQGARRVANEIVQASNDIDAAYRDMRKTVQGSESDLESLKNKAIEYSQTHITSADTMLEMQALGGQLGILIDDLEEFGVITSNLDISTNMDAEDIALRLGQVANVLDLDIDGMQGFSDALVRLGNNMPTQESNIMNIAQRFAAVANTANFSGSEILAWSAAIASTGQRSEMAATAIGNTVSAIEQAAAGGGDDLKQFASIAQMSADEFKKAWKDDPTEALKAFIEGLKTLKDSDTGAVAALENMGITGVRQQQTLLGLSNTIDKLGDALKMSEDAWNQVDDQWGKAGDAAIEAGKKSDGFSGALAILQNNAQDLSQSLGDSLVVPMKVAAGVLGVITDALNVMPGPVKAIAVGAGALSLAFATVAPVVKVFAAGLAAITAEAATSSGSLGAFAASLLGVGKAGGSAATGTAAFGASLKALQVAGVVTAIMAVAAAVGYFLKETDNLRKSTDGLSDAFGNMDAKYAEYAAGANKATESIIDFHSRTSQVIEEQANLAERLSDKWGELGTNSAMLDELVASIEELTAKGQLNEDEIAQLEAAVKRYNEMTGASVSVIDAHTGKLSVNTEELRRNADAYKDRAEAEAAYEMYKDTYKQRAKDLEALEDAEKKVAEATEEVNNTNALNVIGMDAAVAKLAIATNDYNKLKKEVASADETLARLSKSMDSETEIIKEMYKALEDANASTKDFDNLTSEELDKVIAKWDGTAQSVIDAIKEIKDHSAEANAISEAMSEGSKKAAKERAEALKKQLDAEYKEQKREYDRIYKEQQREYDREYKQAQKAKDADYKLAQKAYDNEYKQAQKAFDAAYKQAQKAYDAEYKQVQKALDAEYKARKKVLDESYKNAKKALDAEYDDRKKHYDSELKLLKKAQDAEVDAFNKATDAKLKAMEREYKEKLRLLELEYGQYDSSLEEEIKRLDAETEAEKKAIEERNENDKIAELQRDVEKANSRRKRAEAEKALNDYLQELDQKHNEEQRATEQERLKETQEALKDELQQRKDALKEQYDADVAAYKEKRAVELDALKEANEVEYEAKKEYYDLELAALKEAHEVRLEAIKEQNDEELSTLKEAQSAQLESIKEAQSAQLEALKEDQTSQLEALKEYQSAQLESIKETQQQELDDLKQHQQDQLESMKQDHQDRLDELKEHNDKMVDEAKEGNSEVEAENEKHEQKTEQTAKRTGEKYAKGLTTGYDKAIGTTQTSSKNILKGLDETAEKAADAGKKTGGDYSETLRWNLLNASNYAWDAAKEITDTLNLKDKSGEWGGDMMSAFTSSIVETWNHYGYPSIFSIGRMIADILGHSTPKKGPLHGDDKWGGHFMDNLINGMRSKEGELVHQVEKMARAVEEGFDPTLSVDAAYEAIDTINKGRSASMAQLMADNKNQAIEINVSISDVSVRSDADIEMLADEVSRRMADQLRRQRAGRL